MTTIQVASKPLFAEAPAQQATMRKRALYYADKGWNVFPLHTVVDGRCTCGKASCDSPGKHPRAERGLTEHGYKEATTDAEMIDRWWGTWPNANVGFHPGPSGILVLDLDTYKANYAGVELTFEEKQTVTCITGGGGEHLFFDTQGEQYGSMGKQVDGYDIKGWGGHVVLPPSAHMSGNRYTWEMGYAPWEHGLAPVPGAVAELYRQRAERKSAVGSNGNGHSFDAGREFDRARDALERLADWRADDYDNWMRVGMALAELGDAGFDLWDEWSKGSAKYKEGITWAKWKTFKPGQGITLATLHHLASLDSPVVVKVSKNGAKAEASEEAPAQKVWPETIRQTDLGNALRMARQFGRDLMHIQTWGKWYVWSGKHWQEDETNQVRRLARDTVRNIYAEAADMADEEARKAVAKWGMSSESKFRFASMIDLAKDDEKIASRFEELDQNPWLLNVANGTIDLRTGTLRPHDRADKLTKMVPIPYDPGAEAPVWMKFLRRVLANDESVIEFVQRAVGYSLTGEITEQCLFFLWGTGQNGKTTFIETVCKILADYGKTAPRDLVQLRSDNSEGIPNDVAQLPGIRFVHGAELEQGRRLAESKIKDLTGGDRISARFMRGEFFEFSPRFKIWLFGNHKPPIVGTDEGIWRRIRLIEFTVHIPDEEVDLQLEKKLDGELSGILRWAVEGCLKWQKEGLSTPVKVKAATAAYRANMDVLGQFIDACCVVGKQYEVPFASLYKAYEEWCNSSNEYVVSSRRFGDALTERGFLISRTNVVRTRTGIGLLTEQKT